MLVHQKTMFDHFFIKSFCHLKTYENASKSSFLYYYNGTQKHEQGSNRQVCVKFMDFSRISKRLSYSFSRTSVYEKYRFKC